MIIEYVLILLTNIKYTVCDFSYVIIHIVIMNCVFSKDGSYCDINIT